MITSKQRAKLRSMANTLDTVMQIGKGGITESVVKQAEEAISNKELIKVRVLESALLSAREACEALCAEMNAEPVQCIGSRFVIFKRNEKKPVIDFDA
ncbi:YhbY family RNA-binding protein [Acidaminobacterium chupaoyuni]